MGWGSVTPKREANLRVVSGRLELSVADSCPSASASEVWPWERGQEGERKEFEGGRQVGGEQEISLYRFGAGRGRKWGEYWAVSALPLETGGMHRAGTG